MKYIIFKKGELVQPLLFGEQINHSEISIPEGWKPVSAGYCYPDKEKPGAVTISLDAEAVDIDFNPRLGDEYVIGMMLKNQTDPIHYLDQGDAIYPNVK